MKIYLFSPENGAYLGEDFADEEQFRRGSYIIPDDATAIPPPKAGSGWMPFFNVRERRWEIRPIPALRKGLLSGKLEGDRIFLRRPDE